MRLRRVALVDDRTCSACRILDSTLADLDEVQHAKPARRHPPPMVVSPALFDLMVRMGINTDGVVTSRRIGS